MWISILLLSVIFLLRSVIRDKRHTLYVLSLFLSGQFRVKLSELFDLVNESGLKQIKCWTIKVIFSISEFKKMDRDV